MTKPAIPAALPDQVASLEKKLGETENRFRIMADAAPVLLWMADTDSLCTFFNQTWLDFTGRTLEEEWGIGWAEGIHFEDLQRSMDTYMSAFNERRMFEMEYRLRRHDGEYRWILDRGLPRYLPDHSFAGYIGSCIDITDRKRMEVELVKAVRDRDEFLSLASHALRTPLTTLQLAIESLRRLLETRPEAPFDNGKFARNVETAGNQTTRLITLVEELLDASHVPSGRLEIRPTEFDLRDLVVEVLERMKPFLDAAHCSLEVEADVGTVGSWDRDRLEQVITNLVFNAIKYGAGKLIQVRSGSAKGRARLSVRDHGIGIAFQDQTRIFQRFERAVSTSNYGGLGLGLWISKEIVTSHGGSVEVESSLGQGAIFTVTLPMQTG